ncbi:MAG: DUF2939 domain-containing protein [Armatimonadota bacterium]|nr:DUF2939 domain-containing protein [Armatimonadota bacterium]MDR7445159.1 DUF2939 domain-containing protein [Armatimonadota bacterium]MDR7571246.1 DUF2939 domain-containing protein [Armatimonadota bacterium]MDR7613984.1 DUF2939 domain-containing protein [Armatimonadota bacterium]
MGGIRAVVLALLVLLLFVGVGYFYNSPYDDVIGLAHALRSGDPEAALRWIHVPSLAASVVDALEEIWIAQRTGDPDRFPLSPWLRPFFRAAFGLARPLAQRRVEAEIREMVRRIALGTPDAPVHLPRWGGLPLTVAAVLALVRFEALPEGKIRLSVLGPSPPMQLVLARADGRWVIVAVDHAWLRGLLAPRTR